MFDESNGEEWSLGNWHISPQESLSDYHRAVYDKDNETLVDYTKACEDVDSIILDMIYFADTIRNPEMLTDNNTCCILGGLLLSQDVLEQEEGCLRDGYSVKQGYWTEYGIVSEVDNIIRRLCYGIL